MLQQYEKWLEESKAVFVLSYNKMRMPAVNAARARLREADGALHVVKNRIFAKALENKVEDVYREALADMFTDTDDTRSLVRMMKLREVYRHLSNAADRGDEAANVIADIVVKIA